MPSPTGIAVSWGAAFAFGAYAVVKGSDRPGLSRRMTLLAAWCSAHYVRERNEWRLQHLVRRAYEAPQDTPEKAFWRRVGSLTHDGWGASAFAWRATARNAIADMVANQPAEYEQAARSLANIEHSATTKGDWRYTLNNLYSLLLTSSRESRAFWMLKWLNELEPDEGDSPQILDNAVRQASYMSMIENWENWEQVIYIVSTVGVCVSAVTGELARRRPVLRFSLAMGVCSIAASWTYPLALQHLLETPSRLSRRDWLERLVSRVIADPLAHANDE
ncbi:hypothetical protein PsYK624_044040 [Phanerochaete sordida]|uniref:Uncharacterized protein n=1 Tax=Phanerochaete sordida TaxID=48140 RepID=A0A9P3G4X7_9APHY|nr:hypothetical protein PsYK624_044040 [Phanerochaete sordida]